MLIVPLVSNQRKCKRLLDDGDYTVQAKRSRNGKFISEVKSLDLLRSNLLRSNERKSFYP